VTHAKPPLRRRRLGKWLRALRESAGLTLEAAAPKLDLSRSSLFRVENGETRATVHLARSMMDLYDRVDEGLIDAVRAALKPSWFTAYGVLDMGYTDAETAADRVWDYPGMHLPGLLHTEAYIRALFDHLVMMAELPTVTLHVLPQRSCSPNALDGGFTLLGFPEPEEPGLLYHEYVTGALHIEDEKEVQEAGLVFDSLRGEALNPADLVALMAPHASGLRTPS
jgi:transcriptional regulator with XRE-family HTH domain